MFVRNALNCRFNRLCCRAGIISSLAFNPDRSGLMAAGSYSGQAGLFDDRTSELLSVLQGQRGGITQVCAGCL